MLDWLIVRCVSISVSWAKLEPGAIRARSCCSGWRVAGVKYTAGHLGVRRDDLVAAHDEAVRDECVAASPFEVLLNVAEEDWNGVVEPVPSLLQGGDA